MWIFSDLAQALMAIGILLAVIDILAFGFATLFLTLIGLAMLTSGILIHFEVIPSENTFVLISLASLSVFYSVILWKPLKKLQNINSSKRITSDLSGMTFVLEQDISAEHSGLHHFSGVDWRVESSTTIAKGTEVEVIELSVGVMKVQAKH